jgi:hypothetical protein
MRDQIISEADGILKELIELKSALTAVETAAIAAIERARDLYSDQVESLKDSLSEREKVLLALSRENKETLFADTDRVDLDHGALLYSTETRVKRARGTLERLKQAGLKDAIKIAESVNWDELESWPDKKLKAIGTRRVKKENFVYETI